MQKEKVAFVVVRYGKNINGGAEYHCQMLAERLVDDYDVEVLTTCVRDVATGENIYPEGTEEWNKVLIRRFRTNPIQHEKERCFVKKAKPARKLRQFLFKLGILKYLSYLIPVWSYKHDDEVQAMKSDKFYSSALNDYIRDHIDDYKAFVAMSSDYVTFYYTALYAGSKTIAIPTMHNMGISFRSVLTSAFSKISYVGFNTGEEQKLAENILGKALGPHGILSVGIEEPLSADWEATKSKFQLPDEYLLYIGRITPKKIHRLLSYFVNYKNKYSASSLKLVLVGGLAMERFEHPDIVYTGFVSDEEKMSILQHAEVVVNPSRYESLSLILLEAMNQKKPMLVNGHCKVLKEHCLKSDFASFYYLNGSDFNRALYRIEQSEALRREMGEKGKLYVEENYSWPLIIGRLRKAIESN